MYLVILSLSVIVSVMGVDLFLEITDSYGESAFLNGALKDVKNIRFNHISVFTRFIHRHRKTDFYNMNPINQTHRNRCPRNSIILATHMYNCELQCVVESVCQSVGQSVTVSEPAGKYHFMKRFECFPGFFDEGCGNKCT